MKSSANKFDLKAYEDIFSTEESRQEERLEKIIEVPLEELHPFKGHPFSVRDDGSMRDTVESVKAVGVLLPGIARPRAEGGYEIIAGHRRKHACELAGLETMPVVVRELDDDSATIFMVDSNLQREEILPSERAMAYKMKLEAIKRQGVRRDPTSRQDVGKLESADIVGKENGESGRQIQRYVRLTELVPRLSAMVDSKRIAMSPAVELSYLKPEEQEQLVETIESEDATPSVSQAQRLKDLSRRGKLNEEAMLEILAAPKREDSDRVIFRTATLKQFFPGADFTPKQMENAILSILNAWAKNQQRGKER